MDGFAGAIGVSDSDGKCSPVCICCTPVQDAWPPFYAYVLRHMALSGFITSLARGIRERSTSFGWSDFSDQLLPGPNPVQQRTIADFLDRKTAAIDALIEKKERLLTLLAEKRAALIHKAVTKGLDPDVPMKDSGVPWIGEIPAQWEVRAIKRDTRVRRGASPRPIDDQVYFDEAGQRAWVRIADVSRSDDTLLETTQRLSTLGASKSVPLDPGALFLSIAGTVGKPCIAGIKCCIHDGFVYFPDLTIEPWFLFYVFKGGEAYKGLGKLGTQLNLNTDTVGWIKTPVPDQAEQVAICEFLRTRLAQHDVTVGKVIEQLDKLREYRQALITAAVTGQLDLQGAA